MASEDDAPALGAIYATSVQETAISFETVPPGDAEMARRVRQTLETHPWLVCEGAGGVEGYAYATTYRVRAAYRWSCEVSVYVAGAEQRHGTGRRLYGALLEVLSRQGYQQAYAGITLPNAASVGLHESLGFEVVGVYRRVGFKFGAWHDVGWWQRALSKSDAPPEPIEDIATVCGALDWSVF